MPQKDRFFSLSDEVVGAQRRCILPPKMCFPSPSGPVEQRLSVTATLASCSANTPTQARHHVIINPLFCFSRTPRAHGIEARALARIATNRSAFGQL